MSTTYTGAVFPARFPKQSNVTVSVECVDCHRKETMAVHPPSSRYYDNSLLLHLGLGFMPVPDGWHNTGFGAGQLDRCAKCYDVWDSEQEPVREARRNAEREALEAQSVLDLLQSMAKQPTSQMDTRLLQEAIRKLSPTLPEPPV